MARLRADEQEHHTRRRLKAGWHQTTKPGDLTVTVNDAVVQWQCTSLSGAARGIGICSTSDRSITSQATGQIHWHPDTMRKFKQRIRTLTNPNWDVSMHYQLFKVSQYLRSWINNFGIATGYQHCCDLDHWIRRRVRMAYWRQWRKPRTKVRNLMKLSVDIQAAVACGITSKGPWRSSKTPGIQQALSNDYLKAEGLVSLREVWIKLHHSR